ncbi:Tyrosine-protein phosphatase YwqE [compost metagenome]
MIDIHTHILPGLDDGAADWSDTLSMARAAAAEGITSIIATPHHANGKYTNSAENIIELVQIANDRIKAEGIAITLRPGQEIRVHDELLEGWDRGELLTLASSRYILVEMPSSRIPRGMLELIHELKLMGLIPVIAHPERNAEVAKHPERLSELIAQGAVAQVTAASLLGGFGRRVEQCAWLLCRQGLIHIVSSDAHHAVRRGFRLRESYEAVRVRMGEQWEHYMLDNAQCIAENRVFSAMPPITSAGDSPFRRLLSLFSK